MTDYKEILRLKALGYAILGACIEDISYSADRQLDKAQTAYILCSSPSEPNRVLQSIIQIASI